MESQNLSCGQSPQPPHPLEKQVRQRLLSQLTRGEILEQFQAFSIPYRELMTYYRCAMMEVETKFRVLDEEFSLAHDRNPIESIKTRLKEPGSLLDKLKRKNLPLNITTIEEHVFDIAGVRVICSSPGDLYRLADCLLSQDDVTLIVKKDYIQTPKPNGYRSLHLIVEVPIFLAEHKKMMKVEIQLRTIAMDFWASLEHKLRYKKDMEVPQALIAELRECADLSASLDARMEAIRSKIEQTQTKT